MLIDPMTNAVVLGVDFDLSAEDVIKACREELSEPSIASK